MQKQALNPSRFHSLPPSQLATLLIGEAIVRHRVHKTPETKARLVALAEMARALDAITASDWQLVTGDL